MDCTILGRLYLLKSALPSVFSGSEYINMAPIYNGLIDPVIEEWLQTYFSFQLQWQYANRNARVQHSLIDPQYE